MKTSLWRRLSRPCAWAAIGALGVLMAPGACRTFEPIEAKTCGNAIVDAGEDCDSFDVAGVACAPAGSAHECRFDCSAVDGVAGSCPPGFGCGTDSVCRGPSGAFGEPTAVVPAGAALLLTADFNGDGRRDVLAVPPGLDGDNSTFVGPGGLLPLRAHFFGADGSYDTTTILPATVNSYPSVGNLGDPATDTFDDIALNVGGQGVSVYRGRADGTFSPSVYSSQPLPADEVHVWGQNVLEYANEHPMSGQEPMVIISQAGVVGAFYADESSGATSSTLVLAGLGSIAELISVPAADLWEDPLLSPCDEFVLAFRNDDKVRVVTPCFGWDKINAWDVANTQQMFRDPTLVHLPPNVHPVSLQLFDLDGDGHLDLLIGTGSGALAAYGRGDMTFDSVSGAIGVPDNQAGPAPYPVEALGPPLAVGHLNSDAIPDYVTDNSIWLSGLVSGGGGGPPQIVPGWSRTDIGGASRAAIGDFNANGIADVVLARFGTGLGFYSGAGDGLFNFFDLQTDGTVKDMVTGDFDGDVITDIAVAIAPDPTDTSIGGDSLSVAFGKVGAAPDAPVSMGRLGTIVELAVARFMDPVTRTADGIAEVGVVSRTTEHNLTTLSLAILYGSTGRQMESPFALFTRVTPVEDSYGNTPMRTAIGEYSATADHPDLAVMAMAKSDAETYPRLWLSEAEGDALLADADTKSSDEIVAATVALSQGLMASVDADGDGIAEIVGLAPKQDTNGDYTESVMLIATSKDDAVGGRIFDPQPLSGTAAEAFPATIGGYTSATVGSGSGGGANGVPDGPVTIGGAEQRILVADVDGDKHPDLVAIGVINDATNGYQSHVVVFWNSGSSDPLQAFATDKRTTLPVAPNDNVTGVAALNLDADGALELVAVGEKGAYLFDPTGRDFAAPTALSSVPPGTTVVAADLTGDGLDDLVVADAKTLRVLPQEPLNR